MSGVLPRLRETFGPRLRYLGLQGSYRRGEATEASDIDLVVLLDAVEPGDLDAYRAAVQAMPEGRKACGFLCGTREFSAWPPHELFAFGQDTADYFGRLDDFLPPVTRDDVRYEARTGASTLLHLLTHSYLYANPEARPAILKEARKSAFFLMQLVHYLKSGRYCASKGELLSRLDHAEREILMGSDAGVADAGTEQRDFETLLDWCREVMGSV